MKFYTNKKEKFNCVINKVDFVRWIRQVEEIIANGYDWSNASMIIRGTKDGSTEYFFDLDDSNSKRKLVFTIEKRTLMPIWCVENQKSDVSDPENGGEGQN